MDPYPYIILSIISFIITAVSTQYFVDMFTNQLFSQNIPAVRPRGADQYLMQDKVKFLQAQQPRQDKVLIKLYYECLCPDCRQFDTASFTPILRKLGKYLNIQVYPYGNAKTLIHDDGSFEFKCQHGPAECYGNMLHACAIDNISNYTTALLYNSCMMDYSQNNKGSDDEAADKCGRLMNINSEPIKTCAKGQRGLLLLKDYGDSSKMAGFRAVPYILINGVKNSGDNFAHDVCAAFKHRPPGCNE